MQGVGSLLSVFIVICCLSLGMSDGFTWRFALAFGALPVLIAFPFRLRMHETETFKRVKAERQVLETLNKETQEVISMYQEAGVSVSNGGGNNAGAVNGAGGGTGYGSMGTSSGKHKKKHTRNNSDGHEMMQLVTDFVVHDDFSPAIPNTNNANNTTNPTSNANTTIGAGGASGAGGAGIARFSPHAANTTHGTFPSPQLALPHMTNPTNTIHTHDVNETTSLHTHQHNTTTTNYTTNTNSIPTNTPTITPPTRMNELNKAFKYYKYHMLGTALCWFLLDIDFYANGLFNHEITSSIFSLPNQRNTALQDAYYSGILSLIALPGYWLSVLYIDTVGRKNLQMIGFGCMAGLFFICSLCYEWLMEPTGGMYRKYLFLVIYALTFLFR